MHAYYVTFFKGMRIGDTDMWYWAVVWSIHTNGYKQILKLQSMTDRCVPSVVEFTGLLIVGQHHQRTCMHSRLESLDNAVHKRRGDIDSYHCTDNHATSISNVALTYRAVWLYEAGSSRHVTSFPGFPHLILCIHNVSIITTGGMEGQTGIWNAACTNQPSYVIQPTLENQFAYSGIQHSIDSGISKICLQINLLWQTKGHLVGFIPNICHCIASVIQNTSL